MVPYDQPETALRLVGHWLDHLGGGQTRVSAGEGYQYPLGDDKGLEL
jgi:hypothetical protein